MVGCNSRAQFSNASRLLDFFLKSVPFDYIHTHLDEEIRVTELADIVDMSRYHFANLFKQTMGISPYQYVLRQRVEQAKRLLKQQDLSLAEIASACGFANQSHFIKRYFSCCKVEVKQWQRLAISRLNPPLLLQCKNECIN